jgi:6-phosphofructokinase 2
MIASRRETGAASVVTVTMNPAVDVSTEVARVVSDDKLRCVSPRYEPGGGGINVARVIGRLGGSATALFPSGGPAGRLLETLLETEGVDSMVVPIRGFTRENLNVVERATGRQFRFVLPGPALAEAEWEECFDRVRSLDPFPSYLVASGSLPPSVPEDFYARLARLARQRGARFVLDASGPALERALDESVFLWKPSLRELQAWAGETGSDEAAWRRTARRAVEGGHCEIVVLSLGGAGLICASREGEERLAPPAVSVCSAVGAGDSLVAGIVFTLACGRPIGEAVRYGMAAAAAAVMNPGTELCRKRDVDRLVGAVATAA